MFHQPLVTLSGLYQDVVPSASCHLVRTEVAVTISDRGNPVRTEVDCCIVFFVETLVTLQGLHPAVVMYLDALVIWSELFQTPPVTLSGLPNFSAHHA